MARLATMPITTVIEGNAYAPTKFWRSEEVRFLKKLIF
jgi:hypothetical protein